MNSNYNHANLLRQTKLIMYSNDEIIDGIIRNDQRIIEIIYKTQYPIVYGWIRKNKGTSEDTDDLFHEAFIIILRKIKAEGLYLNCSFSTYLFSICKHLWFQELRKKSRMLPIEALELNNPIENDSYDNLEDEKLQIFLNQLDLLDVKCRQLLLLYCKRNSLNEIMKLMGFKNAQAVADKKKNCRKKLIKNLLNCKEYRRLQSEIFINN